MTDPTAGPEFAESSYARLPALLDRLPSLFWATNRELLLTTVAGGALQGLQREPGYFACRPLNELFPSTESDSFVGLAHRAALAGERRAFTVEFNGRELQAFLEPILDSASLVIGAVGLAIDSTERLVAERALRISEHSYRSLIEEAPSAIFRATMSGQLLQLNRATLDMLGYESASESELLLRDLPQIFSPAERFEEFRAALLAQPVVQGFEAAWIRRDGHEINVSLSGRALRDAGGEAFYLDVLATDVTEKKQLEAQLSHGQRMQLVGQLAGGVAHDFNNLLTIIGGHLQLVAIDYPEVEKRLIPVMAAADRAGLLTRQLLAFSRRQVLKSRRIEVNEVVGRFVGLLSPLVPKSIVLRYQPGEDVGFVHADASQIEQVLMNLAINAQDAMSSGGGEMTVATERVRIAAPWPGPDSLPAGDYVRIVVRDTGHGMPAETQARIFEPFFTTKGIGEGTGLGLSMTYGIVRQSGGHISVDSAVGKGSTFVVHLPRVKEPPFVPEAPVAPAEDHQEGHGTVLLAEDEDGVRELVGTYLEHMGYSVISACDGREALSKADSFEGEISLLVTDMVMPNMGGRQLVSEIRKARPGIRVILMSGYGGNEAGALDLDAPNVAFLAKAFTMNALARTISDVMIVPSA